MKKLNHFSRAIVPIVMMLVIGQESFARTNIDGIYYTLNKNNNTATVTYGTDYIGNIVIPSIVVSEGISYTVTTIGESAFNCDELNSIVIPNTVKEIEKMAFYKCPNLTSVVMSNSLTTIGKEAFYGCKNLSEIEIPNSVTDIDDYAFTACYRLSKIVVKEDNRVYDSRDNCNAIIETNTNTLITGCKNTKIPNSVKTIDDYAFYNCNDLVKITIPNSVTSIGIAVFDDTDWYDNQPDGILYLDNCCLGYKGEKPSGALNIKTGTRLISDHAFGYCDELTTISIPSSVKFIGPNAFNSTGWYDNQSNGILYLDNCCLGYKGESPSGTLNIKSGTRLISDNAFDGCYELTSVSMPNTLKYIGNNAFDYCIELASLSIPKSVSSIGHSAFSCCGGLTSITLPESITTIEYNTFRSCYSVKNVVIPKSVTTIGSEAFAGCSKITEIEIPNSVKTIEDKAFYLCTSLSEIEIPNSITAIGYNAFNSCVGLTVVNISDLSAWCNIEFENTYANPLSYASKLKLNNSEINDLTIPESVAEIKSHTFNRYKSLCTLNLPETCSSIGFNAFSGCESLVKITSFNVNPPICVDNAFEGCYNALLMVPKKSLEKYASANEWNKFNNIQEIASVEGVETDSNAIEIARYDIYGRRLDAPIKGINIVKYSDGTTRKECVKK